MLSYQSPTTSDWTADYSGDPKIYVFLSYSPKNISDVWTLVLGCREDLRSGPCTGKICVADLKQLKIEVELIVLNRGNGHGPWAFLCEKTQRPVLEHFSADIVWQFYE